jgi:hypothetical protein|tara:strand:- start:415 stop:861 length:447 start_codon:yes stop_codon:yes gene_type:complete
MNQIAPMSSDAIAKAVTLEAEMRKLNTQVNLATSHLIHAGLYHRTVFIPAGVLVAGAFVRIDTTIIVHGDITVYVDGDPILLTGHNVLPAYAGRKQAAYAHRDTYFTMSFATEATTVEQAEEEFTNEVEALGSRRAEANNVVMITGGA